MPADILAPSNLYPPQRWAFLPEGRRASTDPMWSEMTSTYAWTMVSRHFEYRANSLGKVITRRNSRLFSDEAYAALKVMSKKQITFEKEADADMVECEMEYFRDQMTAVKKDAMSTIVEEQMVEPEACILKPRSTSMPVSIQDIRQLAEFQRLVINNEVEECFRQRLQGIIQQYSQIASQNARTRDPALEHALFLLRDEVQARVVQHHMRSMWRMKALMEPRCTTRKPKGWKAIRVRVCNAFHP